MTAVFQTAGLPPNMGSTCRAAKGSRAKSIAAARKMAAVKVGSMGRW